MKRLWLFLFFLFLFAGQVTFVYAAFFDRDNCDEIPSNQRVTNGTMCLQRTTAGGRTAGRVYIWSGSVWAEIVANATSAGSSGDVQYNNGASGMGAESAFNYDPTGDVLSVPSLTINGALKLTSDIEPVQITSDQDNYGGCNVGQNAVCRVSTDATRMITGIAGGSDGALLFFYNQGTNTVTLGHQIASSTAGNRLDIGTNLNLTAGQGLILQYDAIDSRWRAASGVSGGVGGGTGFSGITSGTNTTAAMIVGTGGSLTASGSGVIAATTSAALAANPANCPAGQAAAGVSASGAAEGCAEYYAVGGATDVAIADGGTGASTAAVARTNLGVPGLATSNTWTTGDQNMAAALSFTPPNATGAAPTTLGRIAFDTTPSPGRLKYGANGVTFTIANTAEIQPLSPILTSFAGLTALAGQIPYFTSPTALSAAQAILCLDVAGNRLGISNTNPLTFICNPTSGAISGLTAGNFTKALTATTIGNSIMSELAGVVTVAGGFVVGSGPYVNSITTALTADRDWTIQDIAGIPLVATTEGGAITDTNIAIFKTTAGVTRIVNGGAPGTGTWTNTSTNTGDNKTLVAVGAGGTNTITTPIVASFDGGALTPKTGSGCSSAPSSVVLNTGDSPEQYVLICPTASTAAFGAALIGIKNTVATFQVRLKVNDVDSASQVFAGTFKAQCRASGTSPNSTWGSTVAVSITMTAANTTYQGVTAAITPNGTCSVGADLYLQFNASGSMTDDGDARIVGLTIEQLS